MRIHFISVKIGVVRFAVGVVQTQSTLAGKNSRAMRHDRGSVKRRLAVEKQRVAVFHVTMNEFISLKEVTAGFVQRRLGQQPVGFGNSIKSAVLALLQNRHARDSHRVNVLDMRSTRMNVGAVDYETTQFFQVERRYGFSESELLRKFVGNPDFIDTDKRVRRNNGARGKVH